MLDIPADAIGPAPEIAVEDYIELGRRVVEWATDPSSRPASIAELRDQLAGIAEVSGRIRTMEFVQGTAEHLVIRLPGGVPAAVAMEEFSDPLGNPRCQVPQFYADHCRPGFGPVMTPLDTLLARLGDHTFAQCR